MIATLATAFLATGGGIAARAATTQRVVVDRYTGLAIEGIDPVGYFTDGRVVAGDPGYEAAEAGAIWRFANPDNRSFFLAHPEIYSPRFGGYDPVGIARGVTFAGTARLWLIVGQRLYLFGDDDNRAAFAAHPARYIHEADSRWPALEETLAR